MPAQPRVRRRRARPAPARAYLRRFCPTALVAVPVALGPIAASVARGEGPFGWLGQRSGNVRRPSALDEVPAVVRLPRGRPRPLRRRCPGRCDRGRRGRGCRGGADEPVRLFAAVPLPDDRRDAARRRVRQRVVRRRPGRKPERALRLLRRPAGVRRAGAVDRAGLPRPRPWAGSRLPPPASPLPAPADPGSTTTRGSRRSRSFRGDALAPSPGATAASSAATTRASRSSGRPAPANDLATWALVAVWMALLGLFAVESNRVSASRTAAAFDGQRRRGSTTRSRRARTSRFSGTRSARARTCPIPSTSG